MYRRSFIRGMFGAALLPFTGPKAALAQDNRIVKLVLTFPVGGSSDLMGRILAQQMAGALNANVIVDNRPGAAGSIGVALAARQAADGTTILLGNLGPMVVNPLLNKVTYDPVKDFMPVALVATAPAVLVINAGLPYKSLSELIAAAKATPNSINYGSGGAGTLAHFGGEVMSRITGTRFTHVPYKGGIAATNDLLGGQIDMILANPQPVLSHIQSGRLRALAVTGSKRIGLLPDVRTFEEQGVAGMDAIDWWGIYVPTGTPKVEFDKILVAVRRALDSQDLKNRYAELGVDVRFSGPDELRDLAIKETEKYRKLIKEIGIQAS